MKTKYKVTVKLHSGYLSVFYVWADGQSEAVGYAVNEIREMFNDGEWLEWKVEPVEED